MGEQIAGTGPIQERLGHHQRPEMEPDRSHEGRGADLLLATGHDALMRRNRSDESPMEWSGRKRGPKTQRVCYYAHGGGMVALYYGSDPRCVGVGGSRLQLERGRSRPHACDPPI